MNRTAAGNKLNIFIRHLFSYPCTKIAVRYEKYFVIFYILDYLNR